VSDLCSFSRGEDWHRLRREDFSQVELKADSPELFELIRSMMRTDPEMRVSAKQVCAHSVVVRTKRAMERRLAEVAVAVRSRSGDSAGASALLAASPLFGESPSFLDEILGREDGRGMHEAPMDLGV
jgi:mitosis inhibitor protein kinase SWE1